MSTKKRGRHNNILLVTDGWRMKTCLPRRGEDNNILLVTDGWRG